MIKQVMINGEMFSLGDAKVSVMDHGVLYGDGIFEGIRIYNGAIFELDAHLDRLYRSADLVGFHIGLPKEEFCQEIITAAKTSGFLNAYIRVTVSIQSHIDLATPNYKVNRVIILLDDDFIPEEKYTKGTILVEVDRRRMPDVALPMRAKTVNYLNNILALREAHSKGGQDCVMLNTQGFVAETSASNIFAVKNNVIFTPALEAGILPGITRSVIIGLAKKAGYTVEERLFPIDELLGADEAFLTGTAYEVMPVQSIYGKKLSLPGEVTPKIRSLFKQYIEENPGVIIQ
ncbi:MAG: aminotransferase class IV [Brevinema sp.]